MIMIFMLAILILIINSRVYDLFLIYEHEIIKNAHLTKSKSKSKSNIKFSYNIKYYHINS